MQVRPRVQLPGPRERMSGTLKSHFKSSSSTSQHPYSLRLNRFGPSLLWFSPARRGPTITASDELGIGCTLRLAEPTVSRSYLIERVAIQSVVLLPYNRDAACIGREDTWLWSNLCANFVFIVPILVLRGGSGDLSVNRYKVRIPGLEPFNTQC